MHSTQLKERSMISKNCAMSQPLPRPFIFRSLKLSSTTDFFGVHSACSVAARASYPPHKLREKATAAEARYKQV